MAKDISPQQRLMNFNRMTRQHWQNISDISAAENAQVYFDLPKSRLASKVRVEISGNLNVTHASETSFTPSPFGAFALINRIEVNINNGFSPFIVSGRELYMYNLLQDHAGTLARQASGRGKHVLPTVASSGGTANAFRFLADLPLTLNDRDSVGLLLTQNQETTVTVNIFFGAGSAMLASTSGFTVTVSSLKVTPMVESFTVPPVGDAVPDISVIKLVQSTKKAIAGAGSQELHLPVGMTYRKLLLFIEDASGAGIADSSFSGNFELVFNQADAPYRIKPSILAAINCDQFDSELPTGLYAWDFSYNGISNYGTARDYIDTERLTEFWFRFNATAAGTVTAVYETLSRLRAN